MGAAHSRHAALLTVGCVIAGCAGHATKPPSGAGVDTGIPLGGRPPVVTSFCEKSRKAVPVACPSRFPRRLAPSGPRDRHDLSGRDFTPRGYAGYFVNFYDSGARTDDFGHVILAAQPEPFSLTGEPGTAWPRRRPDSMMRIGASGTLVRRTSVHRLPAIVVRSKPYAVGGIHGGHIFVLWNEDGHGYLVSLHYAGGRARYSETQRTRAAAAIAQGTQLRAPPPPRAEAPRP